MPCSGTDEIIRVVVDQHDRLKDYSLQTGSCEAMASVQSFLLDVLKGRSLDDILRCEPEEFQRGELGNPALEESLRARHLHAIKLALEVLTGRESGGPNDTCAAARISLEDDDTVITARLSFSDATRSADCNPVRSGCQGCRGCHEQ